MSKVTLLENEVIEFSEKRSIAVRWGRAEIEERMSIKKETVMDDGNVILFFKCWQRKFQHYFIVLNPLQTEIQIIGYTTLDGIVVKVWEREK